MGRGKDAFYIRRRELALEIWKLFIRNGYETTPLSVIMEKMHMNKGSFYHYFPSKEWCLDYAIEVQLTEGLDKLREEDDPDEDAETRLENMEEAAMDMDAEIKKEKVFLYYDHSSVLYQKLIVAKAKHWGPLFAGIIEAGVSEGVFQVDCPLETAQMLIVLNDFYLDPGLFQWKIEELNSKSQAYEQIRRKLLYSPGA